MCDIRGSRRVPNGLAIGVVVSLQLQLLTGVAKGQNLDAAQHIAAFAAHGVGVAVFDHDESVGVIKRTCHIGLVTRSRAQPLAVDRAGFARLGRAKETDFIAVDAVGKPRLVVLVPGLPGVLRINVQVRAAVQHIVTFATLQVIGTCAAEQGVVAQGAVHPVAVRPKARHCSVHTGAIVARRINGVVQNAAGVVIAAHVGGAALLSTRGRPGVDADAQVHSRVGKLDALYVDQVVNAVALGQLVGHANNGRGQTGAGVFGVNRGLQLRSCGEIGVVQKRDGVALLRAAEHHCILAIPGIEAASVGAAIIKVVAGTVGDGVATCTGKH